MEDPEPIPATLGAMWEESPQIRQIITYLVIYLNGDPVVQYDPAPGLLSV